MERLPAEIFLKIFCLLDSQNLATALQVCRKWNSLASDNILWSNLFKERWGEDHAAFYHPVGSKSWKDAYEVQDRCDRFGLGLRIIREGNDYYLIHQGEIQRHLGSRRQKNGQTSFLPLSSKREFLSEGLLEEDNPVEEFWTGSFSSLETWKLLQQMQSVAGHCEASFSQQNLCEFYV